MVKLDAVPRRIASPPLRSEIVAAQIVQDLSRGGLDFDGPPETEASLLGRYQTSRGTLRDALRLLSMQGIVTVKHGVAGGVIFQSPDPRTLATGLAIALSLNNEPLDQVFAAREYLDPLIARTAARKATDDDVEVLRLGAVLIEQNIEQVLQVRYFDRSDLIAAHNDFHHRIAQATHNMVLEIFEQAIATIIDQHSVSIKRGPDGLRETARLHHAIYRAIAEHRVDDAARLVYEDASVIRQQVAENYPHVVQEPVRWSIGLNRG